MKENQSRPEPWNIIATDIKESPDFQLDNYTKYVKLDVRSNQVNEVIQSNEINTVVHLATIVTPGKKSNRDFEYAVDVGGTKNILDACVNNHVKRVIISSSGATYGYHRDHPEWLTENDSIRGNQTFAYSYHKRVVEEMLHVYRENHPELEQVIFRIGTILGENVNNQITDLFKKKKLLGIKGSDSPFVFIWDQDIVACLALAINSPKTGIFNVARDGKMTIDDIAQSLNKKVIRIPAPLITSSLKVLKKLSLTQYGPEQVDFLRYRPVLDNTKLKQEFDFTPTYTSKEVFERFIAGKDLSK
ncbi:NAD-dependent epimerase/dehydratase family protein [Halalkalibacillus halophilus]|uniref:NAD-dependent epimerase/dehydratase family protein n=1 Tax=Halalkalibacillus halophilus TaxID=392827 RepID=UPI00040EC452|nr:NAD-dependent epimerase/dehydratase family protein [Halalkalibacillus halophilus]